MTASPQESTFDGLLRWRCIGPFRGGRVVAVAGSYHEPQHLLLRRRAPAASGKRPTPAPTGSTSPTASSPPPSVGALAVAPSDSNVIYAGTGETTIRIDVSHGDGVYKSTDAGRTWTHVGLRDTRHIGKIRVHPNDPDIVWVAALGHAFGPQRGARRLQERPTAARPGGKSLFVSDKAGAVDLTRRPDQPAHPLRQRSGRRIASLLADLSSGGPDSGLWRSHDGGETWENITDQPGPAEGHARQDRRRRLAGASAGRVWALIEHANEGGLYRSDDYGATWEKVSDNQNLRLPRLVLHPPHRRPGRSRHGLRQQPRLLAEHRRRQDLRRDRHAARRQPRSLDRPARTTSA